MITQQTADNLLSKYQTALDALNDGNSATVGGVEYQPITADILKVDAKVSQFTQYLDLLNQITTWEKAKLDVANAQEYSYNAPESGRAVKRAELSQIITTLNGLNSKLQNLENQMLDLGKAQPWATVSLQ